MVKSTTPVYPLANECGKNNIIDSKVPTGRAGSGYAAFREVNLDLLKMFGKTFKHILPNGGFFIHGDLPWDRIRNNSPSKKNPR